MLEALTSRQIAEWYEFWKLEPWGSRVDWMRSAQIVATIANVNRNPQSRAFTVEDFMPPEPMRKMKKQPANVMLQTMKAFFAGAKTRGLAKKKVSR
jgi:hypothetical protein